MICCVAFAYHSQLNLFVCIGKGINNLRATFAFVRVMQTLFPECLKHNIPKVPRDDNADLDQDEEAAAGTQQGRNKQATRQHMQDAMDDSSDEEEENLEDTFEEALKMIELTGEDYALSNMHRWFLIGVAFDAAFSLVDELDAPFDDATQACRDVKAERVREMAEFANKALVRCSDRALFSQYQSVSEEAFPELIRMWGTRIQRANEQGQEQLGQLMKRILKFGVNKRRKKGKYLRLGKLCQCSNTATQQGLEKLIQKLDVANKSNHRLLAKQRRGMDQHRLKQEGKKLKRERVVFNALLCTPLEELKSQQLHQLDEENTNLS